MTLEEQLSQYMNHCKQAWDDNGCPSLVGWALEHGQPMKFSGDYLPGVKQRCYGNAAAYSLMHGVSLRYAEGFSLSKDGMIVVQHGWLVNDDNEVVECTWEDDVTPAYYGLVVPDRYVEQWVEDDDGWSTPMQRFVNDSVE